LLILEIASALFAPVIPHCRRASHRAAFHRRTKLTTTHGQKIVGLHHVPSIVSDPQRNLDFYAGLLGLRLVSARSISMTLELIIFILAMAAARSRSARPSSSCFYV
jgi:hypothetical protein